MTITLDSAVIFEGELRRAPGSMPLTQSMLSPQKLATSFISEFSDSLLFTTRDDVLHEIRRHDPYASGTPQDYFAVAALERITRAHEAHRPATAQAGEGVANYPATAVPTGALWRRKKVVTPTLPRARPFAAAEAEDEFEETRIFSPPKQPPAGTTTSGTHVEALDFDDLDMLSNDLFVGVPTPATVDAQMRGTFRRLTTPATAVNSGHLVEETAAGRPYSATIASASASAGQAVTAAVPVRQNRVDATVPLDCVPVGRVLTIQLLSNHGDPHYGGLTGVQLFTLEVNGANGKGGVIVPLPASALRIDANPRDVNVDGHSGDPRTPDKLVNGVNRTCDDNNMWLFPFTHAHQMLKEPRRHELNVDLGRQQFIAGIRIWNYNKTADDASRGIRHVRFLIDGQPIFAGISLSSHSSVCVLRAAPGHTWYDFGQSLDFSASVDAATGRIAYRTLPGARGTLAPRPLAPSRSVPSRLVQETDATPYPVGHTLKLVFSSSCGDPYYVGLDALALYDAAGVRICVRPWQVHALPSSVAASASDTAGDVRTAANLAFAPPPDYPPGTAAECVRRRDDVALYRSGPFPVARAWLAAMLPTPPDAGSKPCNMLVIDFDEPQCISLVRFFNYSKDVPRGVGCVELWLDGEQLYAGEVLPARGPSSTQSTATGEGLRACQSVVFSDHADVIAGEVNAERVVAHLGSREQDVLCFNNGVLAPQVSSRKALERAMWLEGAGSMERKGAPQHAARPKTAVVSDFRHDSY